MSGKKKISRNKKPPPLPKSIRDELRMTCALKGYSDIKCGKSRKMAEEYERLSQFFHGKLPNHPPQIKLLAEANLNYRELHDEKNLTVTNKNDNVNTLKRYTLKTTLTRDMGRIYHSSVDITHHDLEKRNHSGAQLISGRNLVEMAQKEGKKL